MNNIPPQSSLSAAAETAYFADSFSQYTSNQSQSALDVLLLVLSQTPPWVESLMAARNRVVSMLGLKNLGAISAVDISKNAQDYCVGERVGIFILRENSHEEVIVEDRDKHLDVALSLFIEVESERLKVTVTTVVHTHNLWGKIYMFFVGPVHKIIVPRSLVKLTAV